MDKQQGFGLHLKATITKRKCFSFQTHTHTYLRPAVNLSKFVLTVEGDHVLGLPQPGISPGEGEEIRGEPGDLG